MELITLKGLEGEPDPIINPAFVSSIREWIKADGRRRQDRCIVSSIGVEFKIADSVENVVKRLGLKIVPLPAAAEEAASKKAAAGKPLNKESVGELAATL